MVKKKIIEKILIILLFIVFFINTFINSNALLLITSFIVFILILSYLIGYSNLLYDKKIYFYILLLGLLVYFIFFIDIKYHLIVFYLYILSLFFLFKNTKLKTEWIIKLLNSVYFIFFTISFLNWTVFHFTISDQTFTIFGYESDVLAGPQSSPAEIDSYSGVIFLINILYYKQIKRPILLIILSLLGIILSFRITPVVAIVVVVGLYFFLKNKYTFILAVISSFIIFSLLMYALINNVKVGFTNDLRMLMSDNTHGRSIIWEQQLKRFFNEADLTNYIFGYGDINLEAKIGIIGNSTKDTHSSYLSLFFNSPFLFFLLILLFLKAVYKNYNQKMGIIVLFIIISAYTNATIISLRNPTYFVFIIFLDSKNEILF